MFKFVTIYRRVDDEMKLEAFFSGVHLPLAEQLPGLLKTEVSRVIGKPGGLSRFHLMYELYFESERAFQAAMLSTPGLELTLALKPWAEAKLVSWFYGDSFAEEAHKPGVAQE
ncbi:MAG: EthD family reductase [Chloroflexi bacterium]|nr:EthD family reductase [Chloroflexota bacterium]